MQSLRDAGLLLVIALLVLSVRVSPGGAQDPHPGPTVGPRPAGVTAGGLHTAPQDPAGPLRLQPGGVACDLASLAATARVREVVLLPLPGTRPQAPAPPFRARLPCGNAVTL
jgi:hypothetical protein